MTITQNVASKLVVGFVVASMLFTLSFAPAKAATTDDLQAQITELLAQIAALQGQAGQGGQSVASGVCPYTWSMDLKAGSTGADVMKLQQFLNADVETRVAASGAGSVGAETTTFGPATAAAVSKFQTKYRAEVLTPAGLVNPTGYFGPGTRAQANKICASAPASDDDSNDDANDDDANDDDSSTDLSGEASLKTFEVNDGEESDIEEGQEDAQIAEFKVEFSDGDAMITRLDVELIDTGTEEKPWKTFEDVSLWVEDEEVARMTADDKDEYLDEDDGTLRFSGLDIVAMEDEEVIITVAVTVQGSVDDIPATWNIGANSIRFIDGDDVTTTEVSTDDLDDAPSDATVSFDIEEEGGDDELIVKSSTADPDARTLSLKDDARSDWLNVFTFRLDTDDSTNDITLNSLPVALTLSSSTYANVVNDVKLVIDGEEFDDFTVASSSVAYLVFDIDGDVVIDAGEEATVEVMVEFKELTPGNEGTTIVGSASSTQIDAEGADTLTVADSQLSGSATGEEHTLRVNGVSVEVGTMDSDLQAMTEAAITDDRAVYTLKFDVTASDDEDIFIAKTAAKSTSTTPTSAGVYYFVTNGSGTEVDATSTLSQNLSSTAETSESQFVVRAGETETFTLQVTYDPDVTGYYAVNLFGINYVETTAGTATTQQLALPVTDFETPSENIPD